LFAGIFLLVLLIARELSENATITGTFAFRGPALTVALAVALVFTVSAGCGGGGTAAVQAVQIVTPPGTSTITVTPSAKSTSGQPLQLPAIQLTLTVD
jgi:hypothetical protein